VAQSMGERDDLIHHCKQYVGLVFSRYDAIFGHKHTTTNAIMVTLVHVYHTVAQRDSSGSIVPLGLVLNKPTTSQK